MPRGVRSGDSATTTNIILREPQQVLLVKSAIERLVAARGGVKITAVQALLELMRMYLQHADKIDPISEPMKDILEQRKNLES